MPHRPAGFGSASQRTASRIIRWPGLFGTRGLDLYADCGGSRPVFQIARELARGQRCLRSGPGFIPECRAGRRWAGRPRLRRRSPVRTARSGLANRPDRERRPVEPSSRIRRERVFTYRVVAGQDELLGCSPVPRGSWGSTGRSGESILRRRTLTAHPYGKTIPHGAGPRQTGSCLRIGNVIHHRDSARWTNH